MCFLRSGLTQEPHAQPLENVRGNVAGEQQIPAEPFQAAEFLMDYLKSRAPFWKKEVTRHGADWVDAKDADEDALGRW